MTNTDGKPLRRALFSLSDKRGAEAFARGLQQLGFTILSTGGTARLLREAGIEVTDVSDHTAFPEMMGGRIKTLHPRIHGGILARRDQDLAEMQQHQIEPIDLVVVNLYPFSTVVSKPDHQFAEAIENIDIGGPTMIRAAAKNSRFVTVVVDPDDYPAVLEQLQQQNEDQMLRRRLAHKAFAHTADYDTVIARWFEGQLQDQETQSPEQSDSSFPATLTLQFKRQKQLRYGENPHQQAALYEDDNESGIAQSRQLQGKSLSYNNLADADAAFGCVMSFSQPACTIVKHANPCGVAVAGNITEAYQRAFETDTVSAFGGIIAFNRELDHKTLELILKQQFAEVIIAPQITTEAVAAAQQKSNLRLLECPEFQQRPKAAHYQRISGGLLVQDRDITADEQSDFRVVTAREPTRAELEDLHFAWQVVRSVKSNAIVFAGQQRTIGIGAGQMSRVYSTRIAALKARDADLETSGSVLASDAFFPFRDGLDTAAEYGISAVIQPGGSIRDDEVIAAAEEHGIAMVFTGTRHFLH